MSVSITGGVADYLANRPVLAAITAVLAVITVGAGIGAAAASLGRWLGLIPSSGTTTARQSLTLAVLHLAATGTLEHDPDDCTWLVKGRTLTGDLDDEAHDLAWLGWITPNPSAHGDWAMLTDAGELAMRYAGGDDDRVYARYRAQQSRRARRVRA